MRLAEKTFLIASGKGGVGKSTVTVNLGIALAKLGYSVGILDADIYGPSIPIMLGLRRLSPRSEKDSSGKSFVIPFTKFGLRSMSIGFFIDEAQPVVWRGPMLHNALKKMTSEVAWGNLDILLVDLPPGTGDVPISLSQLIEIDSAIVVCTPQEVAMLDAIKAINALDLIQIPLLGIIENMAGYQIPNRDEIHHIFGEGKALELAQKFSVPLLGSIPLITAIRRGGDEGYPSAFHQGDNLAGLHFNQLATSLLNRERVS